jgi:HPt (histidine-containing phosphotransfer) domain-containing protein
MDPTASPRTPGTGPSELQPLAAIDGLDVVAGLRQCGNRVPMYRHMLGRFAEIYGQPLPPPAEPEGEPDLPARERAHSLRGASATVGAVRVQALAAALEALCDDAAAPVADRRRAHEVLSAAVAALVASLRPALAGDAPKAG